MIFLLIMIIVYNFEDSHMTTSDFKTNDPSCD